MTVMRDVEVAVVVCGCGFEHAVVFSDGPIEDLVPYVEEIHEDAKARGLDPVSFVVNGEKAVTCPSCGSVAEP